MGNSIVILASIFKDYCLNFMALIYFEELHHFDSQSAFYPTNYQKPFSKNLIKKPLQKIEALISIKCPAHKPMKSLNTKDKRTKGLFYN